MRSCSIISGIILLALGIALGLFVNAAYIRTPSAGEPIAIQVVEGDDYIAVRKTLVSAGLVSAIGYDLYAVVSDDPERPHPGSYAFRKGSSYQTIARSIALGPPREEQAILIIEGKTIDDIGQQIQAYGVTLEQFYSLAGQSKNLQPYDRSLAEDFDFLVDIPSGQSLEGYLFPDTYRVWQDELPEALIRKQLRAFAEKVIVPLEEKRNVSGMSWHEVVTLASIVEAEVQKTEDRKLVAGIFLKRLEMGMRLQTDATLNYVIGEGRTRATLEDLELVSPYNSYTNDGLPPGPINNPSLDSIAAVLEPTESDYLFFLTDPKGNVLYSETYQGHLLNKERAYGD